MSKVVIIGAGRVGCGFVGQLCRASGYQIVFIVRNPMLLDNINRVGYYRVHLVCESKANEIVVDGVRAVSAAEPKRIAEQMADADLIATAVGASNLPDVAPLIAAGLCRRRAPVNVFAFENLIPPGSHLRDLVANYLPADFPIVDHGFSRVLVNRAVTGRFGDPEGNDPFTFIGDPLATFIVEATGLRQPLQQIKGMRIAVNHNIWVRRKLFMYSTGHAATAYLGFLKGYHYIHTAIRDPEIRAIVLGAMKTPQSRIRSCASGETPVAN